MLDIVLLFFSIFVQMITCGQHDILALNPHDHIHTECIKQTL